MIWFFLLILIATVTLVLQLIIGFINSRQVGRVYDYLIKDARKKSRRSFTVVVTLAKRAETIIPLIDHLRGFNYSKLQIIVIVRQTAGSKAQRSLESYRRRTGLRLTIVKHRRGLTYQAVVGRYATGDYVMQVEASDRLSQRFFDLVSQILYSTHVGALIIRNHLLPRRTFLQAAWSIEYLFQGLGLVLNLNRNKYQKHIIVKRKLLTSGREISARPYLADRVYVDVSIGQVKPDSSPIYLSAATSIGVLLAASYYLIGQFAGPYESAIFGIAALTIIEVCAIVLMISLRGYKLIDYVNMLLFVPLLPLYAINKLLQYFGAHLWRAQKRSYAGRALRNGSNIH